MKRYSIIGRSGRTETIEYLGQFEPVEGQSDIVTALAAEFAGGDLNDLNSWLGGNLDLRDIDLNADEFQFENDDSVFDVQILD